MPLILILGIESCTYTSSCLRVLVVSIDLQFGIA